MSAKGNILCTSSHCFATPASSIAGEILSTLAVPCYAKGSGCTYNFDGGLSTSKVVGQTTATMGFTWDFGDGSPQQTGVGLTNPTHDYTANGTYIVSLTVTDSASGTSTKTTTIVVNIENPIPIINFIQIGDCEYEFKGDSSLSRGCDTALSYLWDFGDGTTSTSPNPTKLYASAGTYSVNLTVTDSGGRLSTGVQSITCSTLQIVSDYTMASSNGLTFAFDGSSSIAKEGSIVTYAWQFGDGATSSAINPTHLYAENGDYDVTLTVTDTGGNTDSKTCKIIISQGPIAIQSQIELQSLNLVQADGDDSYLYDGLTSPSELTWNFKNHDSSIYAVATGAPLTTPSSPLISNTHLKPQIDLQDWYESNVNTETTTASFTATINVLDIDLDATASAKGASCSGVINSYTWYIYDEDGATLLATLTGATTSYTVANVGVYTVVLRVGTTTCGESVTGQHVTV